MRSRERKNSNSEPPSLEVTAKPNVGIVRKLEDICQSLTPPQEPGKVVEFLADADNAQRIDGLVDDIHEALIDYQVLTFIYSFSTVPDVYARNHCNKISTMRVVSSLWVLPPPHCPHILTNS